MTDFTLSPPTPADFRRLAEVARAAFADDAFTKLAFRDITEEDHLAWAAAGFETLSAGPGHRTLVVAARETATGVIAGYASWAVPLGPDEAPPPEIKSELPYGMDTEAFGEMIADLSAAQNRLMGERVHWCTYLSRVGRLAR